MELTFFSGGEPPPQDVIKKYQIRFMYRESWNTCLFSASVEMESVSLDAVAAQAVIDTINEKMVHFPGMDGSSSVSCNGFVEQGLIGSIREVLEFDLRVKYERMANSTVSVKLVQNFPKGIFLWYNDKIHTFYLEYDKGPYWRETCQSCREALEQAKVQESTLVVREVDQDPKEYLDSFIQALNLDFAPGNIVFKLKGF